MRQSPRQAPADPGVAGIEDLNQPANLTPNVAGLLSNPAGIEITAYDVFGNAYRSRPLDGSGWHELMRYGLVHTELRVYQHMMPVSPVTGSQGTLPHLFGVHAYISTYRGDDILGIDLRFNNGHSGNDPNDTRDDPLDAVYFERIELTVNDNWFVNQGFEDPFYGQESFANGKRTVTLGSFTSRYTPGCPSSWDERPVPQRPQ